jgi:uncharacterized protein (DUF1697 family)
MPRYVAFLRGVSPMNLKMPQLKASLEAAGCTDVRTVLASGNAVFSARSGSEATVVRKIEASLATHTGRTFATPIRRVVYLPSLFDSDPFARFRVSTAARRVVTFLREKPETQLSLPITLQGARILAMNEREVFSAYTPGPQPVFMTLIEKTFGTNVTTRTWDTVRKCVAAAAVKRA